MNEQLDEKRSVMYSDGAPDVDSRFAASMHALENSYIETEGDILAIVSSALQKANSVIASSWLPEQKACFDRDPSENENDEEDDEVHTALRTPQQPPQKEESGQILSLQSKGTASSDKRSVRVHASSTKSAPREGIFLTAEADSDSEPHGDSTPPTPSSVAVTVPSASRNLRDRVKTPVARRSLVWQSSKKHKKSADHRKGNMPTTSRDNSDRNTVEGVVSSRSDHHKPTLPWSAFGRDGEVARLLEADLASMIELKVRDAIRLLAQPNEDSVDASVLSHADKMIAQRYGHGHAFASAQVAQANAKPKPSPVAVKKLNGKQWNLSHSLRSHILIFGLRFFL